MENIRIDKIVRTKRKTLAIIIDSNAKVIVRAPQRITNQEIYNFIDKKRDWIQQKQTLILNKLNQKKINEFIDGEEFLFLGAKYKLKLVDNSLFPLYFNNNFFIMDSSYKNKAREFMINWYLNQAAKIFADKVDAYSKALNLPCRQLKLSDAKRRWGSCSSKRVINLNWRLVMAPNDIIDYVIVHELCHIMYLNHSKDFWNKVQSIIPDYKIKKNWLKNNGFLLELH